MEESREPSKSGPDPQTKGVNGLQLLTSDALDHLLKDAPDGALDRYRYARERALPLLLRLKDQGERYAALDDVTRKLGLKRDSRQSLKSDLKTLSESNSVSQTEASDSDVPQPGSDRYEQAISLLRNPKLLLLAGRAMRRLGHVGELRLKLLAFVCAISARMGRPIQPSTHAQSSAGKNALWDTTLSLFPPEIVVRRSGLSAKALFRTQVNLKGAILYIQERAGSESAEYTIRVLQSDGRLEYEATEKAKDGSLRNVVYSIAGPTVVVQTTTKNHLHSENDTRVFPLYIDESVKQTKRIVQNSLKEAAGGEIEKEKRQEILELWHDAVKLLEPGDVIIPYAERIVIPSMLVRIRRDAQRLLDIVRVIAWLYQYQRERDPANRIIATEDDFKTALTLVGDSLARAWQTLTPAKEKVVAAIQKLPEPKQTGGFKRRDLKVPDVSDNRVKEVLKSLSETGLLCCDRRSGPTGYTFRVARSLDEIRLGVYLAPQSSDVKHSTKNRDVLDESRLSNMPSSAAQLTEGVTYQPSDDNWTKR